MKKLITLIFVTIISNFFSQNSSLLIPIEKLNIKELKLCSNQDPLEGVTGREYDSKNFIKYSYIENTDFNRGEIETILTNCFDSLRFLNPVNKISAKKISLDTTIKVEQFTIVKGRTAIKDLNERENARNIQIKKNFITKKEYCRVYFINIEGIGELFLITTHDGRTSGYSISSVKKSRLLSIDKSIKAKIRFEDSLNVIKIIGVEEGNRVLSNNSDSKVAIEKAIKFKKKAEFEAFQKKLNSFLNFKISINEFAKLYPSVRDSISKDQYAILFQKAKKAIQISENNFDPKYHLIFESDLISQKTKTYIYTSDDWNKAFDKTGRHIATDSLYNNGRPNQIVKITPKVKFGNYNYSPSKDNILKKTFNEPEIQIFIEDTLFQVKNSLNYISDTAFSREEFRDNFITKHYDNPKISQYQFSKLENDLKKLLLWDNKFQLSEENGVDFSIKSNPNPKDVYSTISYVLSYDFEYLYDNYLITHKIKKKEQAIRKAQREEEEKLAEAERLAQKQKLYQTYGKKYVDAAYDFEFIVGMHEDLANIIVQQLWDVHSTDELGDGSKRYWLQPNSSVGTKKVIITIKNQKITRVSSW